MDRLYDFFAAQNIDWQTTEHAAAFTVAEIPPEVGALPGAQVKNLLLVDKYKQHWLVVALDHTRVDLKYLAGAVGAGKFSFAKPEVLLELLGVTPGSVTPFALIHDPGHRVHVVIETDIFNHSHINGHPLRNTATTTIRMDDFRKFLFACGHPYQSLALTPEVVHMESAYA